jgi:hypothetical protein
MMPLPIQTPVPIADARTTQPVYQPPRPNPGPLWVPASEAALLGGSLVLATVASIVVGTWWVFRRPCASSQRTPGGTQIQIADGFLPQAVTRVRSALESRLGPSSANRTTQEWADALDLRQALGAENASRVIVWLEQADRARFARSVEMEDALVAQAISLIGEIQGASTECVGESPVSPST